MSAAEEGFFDCVTGRPAGAGRCINVPSLRATGAATNGVG